MSGQVEPLPDRGPDAAPEPARVIITFPLDPLLDPHISMPGATTAQLYLAAWLLDQVAREVRAMTVVDAARRARWHKGEDIQIARSFPGGLHD